MVVDKNFSVRTLHLMIKLCQNDGIRVSKGKIEVLLIMIIVIFN